MSEDVPPTFELQLHWAGDMISPPTPVNQFLFLAEPPAMDGLAAGAHIVNFGYFTPPVLNGELSADQIAELSAQPVPVIPVGRFMFTTARLRDLRDVITRHLQATTGDS